MTPSSPTGWLPHADGDNAQLAAQHKGMGTRARIVKAARDIYTYHQKTGRMHYTQGSLRMSIVKHKWRPPFDGQVLFEDCSSFATAAYFIAGVIPDPNGLNYSGWGYTGTLCQHGKPTNTPKGGDLAFYGSGPPWSHVVVVAAKPGYCYSHGHEGGPELIPLNYRPVGQYRTYL